MRKRLANPRWTVADRVCALTGAGSAFALLTGWVVNHVF